MSKSGLLNEENMSFNAIRENEILAKISESTVDCYLSFQKSIDL